MKHYTNTNDEPTEPDYETLHPDDFDAVHEAMMEALKDGPSSTNDLVNHEAVDVSASPVKRRADELRAAGYLGMMRDPYSPVTNLYYRHDQGDPLVALGFNATRDAIAEAEHNERTAADGGTTDD